MIIFYCPQCNTKFEIEEKEFNDYYCNLAHWNCEKCGRYFQFNLFPSKNLSVPKSKTYNI